MIAGTFARLSEPADDPLENYYDSGYRALNVEQTQTYLGDDLTIQSGMIAGRAPSRVEKVITDGHEIDVETKKTTQKVATEWIADVDGKGWILAERTHSSDDENAPPWPFNDLEVRTGREIYPLRLKPWEFIRNQRDAGRTIDVEFVGREHGSDDVSIEWGKGATKASAEKADVGTALTVHWGDQFVRLVLYSSGYLAIWEPDMAPSLLGRFIDEEIVPIAYVGDDETGEAIKQQELGQERDEVSA